MKSRGHCGAWKAAFIVAAAGALVLVGDARIAAYSYYTLNGTPVVWLDANSVRYLSPSTFPPGSEVEIQFLSAMAEWNLVSGSDFNYSFVRLGEDPPMDHFDGYNDTAAVPAGQLDPGVLGVTFLVNSGANWFDMDIVFADLPLNVGYTFDPNPDCRVVDAPTPNNGFSFLLVAIHELGHAIGLGHDPVGDEPAGYPWFVATMNPRYPSGGTLGQNNIIELHADDRGGARFLYPHSGPSGTPYVDLAASSFASSSTLGRAEPLQCSPSALYPGQDVTIPSVIENMGTSSVFFIRQGFYLSLDSQIDTSDQFLGSLNWDIAGGDALAFDVTATLPADLPAGEYYVGAILDDINALNENWEDNNAARCCDPIEVLRLPPVINPIPQRVVSCDAAFVGSAPTVSRPLNMAPITWSLDGAPAGMTIQPSTGVITWPDPVSSDFLYVVQVRATNSAGTTTQPFFLGVQPVAPVLIPLPDVRVTCSPAWSHAPPSVVDPGCMDPIIAWLLETGPSGVHMNADSGVLTWPNPVPSSAPYLVTIRALNAVGGGSASFRLLAMPGDYNADARIDLRDWSLFAGCANGPGASLAVSCSCGDGDADGDLDLRDAASLQREFAP
ncbi:MAG: matrixin family metalloprotease [Phycisphaerae bacterium]|nr:matrixin family metalloprotease [Phycisphaerae bacterium]